MVSIVVEASNGFCSIACLENNKVLSQRNMECSNNLSAIILQEIDNCLNDAGKSKYIITQNGNELYFRDGNLDKNFFSVTDGTTQESLYCRRRFGSAQS